MENKYLITYKNKFSQGQLIVTATSEGDAISKFYKRNQILNRETIILSVEAM